MVFSGLVMLWRLAGWPTRTWPSSVKATIDGVVRPPSAFSITLALFPSITATQELVVPRSMPIAFAMIRLLVQKMRVNDFQCLERCRFSRERNGIGHRFGLSSITCWTHEAHREEKTASASRNNRLGDVKRLAWSLALP